VGDGRIDPSAGADPVDDYHPGDQLWVVPPDGICVSEVHGRLIDVCEAQPLI
jgi:hypothetical protein